MGISYFRFFWRSTLVHNHVASNACGPRGAGRGLPTFLPLAGAPGHYMESESHSFLVQGTLAMVGEIGLYP